MQESYSQKRNVIFIEIFNGNFVDLRIKDGQLFEVPLGDVAV